MKRVKGKKKRKEKSVLEAIQTKVKIIKEKSILKIKKPINQILVPIHTTIPILIMLISILSKIIKLIIQKNHQFSRMTGEHLAAHE